MKRRSKMLFGFVALISVAKYIDNRIVAKLDQDIRMSGAGIEERLAELDLDQLRGENGRHHCKRIRAYGIYQYQTCFFGTFVDSELLTGPQAIFYRYTPPRPFLSLWKLIFSSKAYFGTSLRYEESLGRITQDGRWEVSVRTSILENYSSKDIDDYPISYQGGNFSNRTVKTGVWK